MSSPDPHQWLDQHGSALYAFAMLHLHDAHLAEDAVQETLLSALQAWERFRGDCSLRTWLTGILKHKILDEFRRQQREAPNDAYDLGTAEDGIEDPDFAADGHWRERSADWGCPERCLAGERFWSVIERCIAALPPHTARLFVLRELWEMETELLCKELLISPSNLWTSLYRARLKMRRCLERNDIAGANDDA